MNQIKIHNRIDELLEKLPDKIKKKEVFDLILANNDARHYFFTKADERWLNWLWDNGFLDVIKEKAEDQTRLFYRTPELDYLIRVSSKEPKRVVDIMLQVQISKNNFNPEVVDRFLWICQDLPAGQLARIVPKIRDEGWVRLMGVFNRWGFEYEKMLKTLSDAKDYSNLLTLAEVILAVKNKEEMNQKSGFGTDNPFYFNNLKETKIFEYIASVNKTNEDHALKVAIDIMKSILLLGEKEEDRDKVFNIREMFYLFDVDFFEVEIDKGSHISYRDNIENLAAVIKVLSQRLIGDECGKSDAVHELYNKHFKELPDSQSMWRLKLFVLSLCPEDFKDELKQAFFRLFEVKKYHDLISGTEYLKALRIGFPVLSKADKDDYVIRVINYFLKRDQEKESEKENWHIRYGSRILSMIIGQLTEEEQRVAKGAGFKLEPGYEPQPSIGKVTSGVITSRGPVTKEELGKIPVADIAKKLRNEWSPKELSKQNKGNDFLNPLNAEGLGELLRANIPERPQNFVENADLFFERDVLDEHYTYSFLRGVQEFMHNSKDDAGKIDYKNLIALLLAIKESGEEKPFDTENRERETFDVWLANWISVHSVMVDVLQEILRGEKGKILVDFSKYRKDLFSVISYLLAYPDPKPEDEKIETAKAKVKSSGSNDYLVSDPFSIAINSVRGRAFEAFVLFVYQDDEEKTRISPDTKKLYEAVLKSETTRAIMFMFGHYLPSFYFRDKDWIKRLLPQIFPTEQEKTHLYTAAWEGYVTANLYEEIFFDSEMQKLYERGILTDIEYPEQKPFKDPDEGMAVHIALAFLHFQGFGFKHDLFKKFWGTPNIERHKEFISFIGRHCISRDNAKAWAEENKVDIGRLRAFWDWALENCKEKKIFAEFGFWMKAEGSVFEIPWLAEHIRKTLEKSGGAIEWDYGMVESLPVLAVEGPVEAVAILGLYFKAKADLEAIDRGWLYVDDKLVEIFKILYENPATKDMTYKLIDELLPLGNGHFWRLKEVLS